MRAPHPESGPGSCSEQRELLRRGRWVVHGGAGGRERGGDGGAAAGVGQGGAGGAGHYVVIDEGSGVVGADQATRALLLGGGEEPGLVEIVIGDRAQGGEPAADVGPVRVVGLA